MKCSDVKKLFPDYLMMEVEEDTISRVEDHISECSACRSELESSSEMWAKMEVLPIEFPDKKMKKNFYEMLDVEIRKEKAGIRRRAGLLEGIFNSLFLRKMLFSPAAILLLVISGFLVGMFVTSGKLPTAGGIQETVKGRDPVQVMTSDQSGIINILNAYEDLRTGSWTEDETLQRKKDPAEMNVFEFFRDAAFDFAGYFDRIITL